MLEKITSVPRKAKNHVVKHRAKYTFVVTTAIATKVQMQVNADFNAFLKEKDLFEEFYNFIGE